MMPSQHRKSEVMLVAIEHGGQWRANLMPREGVDLIMVVQVAGEDPLVFARRFLRKALGVIARDSDVVSGVLAVAPTFDTRYIEARCTIARTLLRIFRRDLKCRLHFVEPSNRGADCRAHLLAIAEGLTEGFRTDCDIRVGHEHLTVASANVARLGR